MSADTTTASGVTPVERSDRPIAAGVNIGHVHLKTADIDRVHDFYVGILGFDVVTRIPQALFLSAGGYHHHLGFNTWESKGGSPPPPGTTGLYHVAIKYPTRAALGRVPPPGRSGMAARRLQRPRHARGALPPRSRRERPRAGLGPSGIGVASRRRGTPGVRQPPAGHRGPPGRRRLSARPIYDGRGGRNLTDVNTI